MHTNKHLLFVVPDGIGIKNYLHSEIISHIKDNMKISIWSPLPLDAFLDVKDIHDVDFNYKQIKISPENTVERIYREATTFARLKHNSKLENNSTILSNWRKPKYSIKMKLLYQVAEVLGHFLSKKYQRILKYEDRAIGKVSQSAIDLHIENLKDVKVSSIFITHQRVAGLLPICLAAKKLGIKTTTAIFSWDNLPKARLAVKTDNYLVWSDWMKNEMKTYYQEIPQENVKLVGTPQFEFYKDKSRVIERHEFASQYGLDVNKKWICFSGDDVTTSPYDQLFLKDVTEAIQDQKDEIQIIFRRCPVDFSSRYDTVLNAYKELVISIDPIWNNEAETGWAGYFPRYDDINLQINLAYHCELVANLGSTMAIDFATFNKPCLYLNYNPSEDEHWSTEIIYNFQHFRSMHNLDAVGWINSKNAIKQTVLNTIEDPHSIAKDRKEWMKIVVQHPIDKNSDKIAKALL